MILADFRCLDCGEVFGSSIECAIHHLETKHNRFNIIGSDSNMNITSGAK